MDKFIKIQLLKADLDEIDAQLQGNGFKDMLSVLLIKQAFIAIANLVDFELSIRPIYQEHKELSVEYKKASKEYEFAKYLRNKFIGHVKPELLRKAIEWRPELRYLLKRTGEKKSCSCITFGSLKQQSILTSTRMGVTRFLNLKQIWCIPQISNDFWLF